MADLDPATECHACDTTHEAWERVGKHTVSGPHHAGIIEHWECGCCGAITEVARR